MAAHGSGKEFDPDNPVVVTPLVRARTTNHEICQDLTRTSCFLSRRPRVPTLVALKNSSARRCLIAMLLRAF